MILPGLIAKGLALIDALLDFWVDEVGTTVIGGACGNLTVPIVHLNACGEELLVVSHLTDLPLDYWVSEILPSLLAVVQ